MKIIKPSASIMEHNVLPYEFIERVGRTCYKSEDKITTDSAKKFVESLVKREHMAMLEHEHIYITTSPKFMKDFLKDMDKQNEQLKYFNITHKGSTNIISGSFRSFYDLFKKDYPSLCIKYMKNGLSMMYPVVFGDFKEDNTYMFKEYTIHRDLCAYTRGSFINLFKHLPEVLFKHLTHTIKFVCDRGVSHEFVRHRVASFAQESTRYCNYSKDKFGKEITVIDPCFWESGYVYNMWKEQCELSEKTYFILLDLGSTPQEARTVLPNSLKTELIITATEEEWQHIVNLRYKGTTGSPHPQMKEVMGLIIDDLVSESNNRIKKE